MQQLVTRAVLTGLRRICTSSQSSVTNGYFNTVQPAVPLRRSFSKICQMSQQTSVGLNLLQNSKIQSICNKIQTRTVIKFSMMKGKRKSVKAVTMRFYRLKWGIWIRTIAGRHKHLWKKSGRRKKRYLQHVFCNATQSTLLDKMAGKYWRKHRYYVDDPYEPYHSREEFQFSSIKPKPYFPPENTN